MTTMTELQALAYPRTYTPLVAGPPERRNVLLVEAAGGPEGVAVRPLLLCQDWDQRVVIHWEDDHDSSTYTVLDVVDDSAERFTFQRDEPAGTVSLTPLDFRRFEREYRTALDPDAGNVPRFESDDQFRRWYLQS
ncbi:MAG: hypothetical protein ACYDCQ_04495 [Dehalococcoidia bacterium]